MNEVCRNKLYITETLIQNLLLIKSFKMERKITAYYNNDRVLQFHICMFVKQAISYQNACIWYIYELS